MLDVQKAENYIAANYEFSSNEGKLISNILHYVDENCGERHAQYEMLAELFRGTDLSDREIREFCGVADKNKVHNKENER